MKLLVKKEESNKCNKMVANNKVHNKMRILLLRVRIVIKVRMKKYIESKYIKSIIISKLFFVSKKKILYLNYYFNASNLIITYNFLSIFNGFCFIIKNNITIYFRENSFH